MRWIDASRPLDAAPPVFPGDDPPRAEAHDAEGTRMTRLSLLTHSGTHLDLPAHVLEERRRPSEAMILRALIGPARVLRIPAGDGASITLRRLRRALGARPPARLLLRTGPRPGAWRGLDPEAAAWLAGRCRLVGTDALSIDPPGASLEAHRRLLAEGTLILENLLLERVLPGAYHLLALPLRLACADGAPVRALLRPRERGQATRGGRRT